jgi:cytochrome subunit of sulfide dehydrogenase
MKAKLAVLAMLLAAAAPAAAQSAAPAGAAACSGCHARTAAPDVAMPPVHGRPAEEIVAAMQAFRTGERAATVMDRIAKGFSAEETRAIAAWLSGQR